MRCLPRGQGVFNVVGGGVDEDSTLVPGSTLHSDVLVNVAQTLQLAVADHDCCGTIREQFHMSLCSKSITNTNYK